VAKALNDFLKITADWETLNSGKPEERACFAALGIQYRDVWLTRADDGFVNRLRDKVHLSAYQMAQWLAWNWWRLRWEPRARASRPDWAFSHRMTTIGGGYVWPNITIFSDGERIVLQAKPTQFRLQEPLHYIENIAAVVRANAFEKSIDQFIEQVRGQLRAEHVGATNLDDVWESVLSERTNPATSERRKFEALLGFDPDEADDTQIDSLIADAKNLGERAIAEVAADRMATSTTPTGDELKQIAHDDGFESDPRDTIRFHNVSSLSPYGEVEAWVRGAEAARLLRIQEQLGAASISNEKLANWAAVSVTNLIDNRSRGPSFSFALDENAFRGRVVLRSKWETGRRFELARLIGDRVAGVSTGKLFPATRSYTYRQQLRRSFAAELLCPFDALMDMLRGDFSSEALEDAASHFNVSERTVRTVLMNHRQIERDDIEGDPETGAAA
jgi:hypothetical protein